MDIEGAEKLALTGGKSILSRTAPTILMEINPKALSRMGS
jgi:hypothetical protein